MYTPQASREELERVDLQIPTAFAQASKSSGCVRHISLLTSVGANADAKPGILGTSAGGGLYLGTKGKVRGWWENMCDCCWFDGGVGVGAVVVVAVAVSGPMVQ